MSRMRTLVLLIAVLAPVTADAQVDTGPDGVGVYFDAAATQAWAFAAPFQPVTAYLVITNPGSAAGVAGAEVRVAITGGLELSHAYACAPLIVDDWPCARFLCPTPLVQAPAVVVASIQVMATAPGGVVEFRLGPCTPSLLPGTPSWLPGDAPAAPRPLNVSSGAYDLPVARINGEPVVPAGGATWGAVKGLYGR